MHMHLLSKALLFVITTTIRYECGSAELMRGGAIVKNGDQHQGNVKPFHLRYPKMKLVMKEDSSPLEQILYVTYNGSDSNDNPIQNIYAFDENGHQVGPKDGVLDQESTPYHLKKLRGMTMGPDGDLYVVVGAQAMSKILIFHGKPNSSGKHIRLVEEKGTGGYFGEKVIL